MKINNRMKSLLQEYRVEAIEGIPWNDTYPIWENTDIAGRVYWGVSSFCGLNNHPIHKSQDLSRLEWDSNEVYLDGRTDEDVAEILWNAIGILKFWKNELETRYPDTPFYLFASYDYGDMLIPEEGESPVRSVTLRFWADRGGDTVINLTDFDCWEQPAILEYCNF